MKVSKVQENEIKEYVKEQLKEIRSIENKYNDKLINIINGRLQGIGRILFIIGLPQIKYNATSEFNKENGSPSIKEILEAFNK